MITSLKAFGYLCFVSSLPVGRDKFMTRAHPCVFIGYPFAQKSYKVLSLVTHVFAVSIDVKIFEYIFPLHAIKHSSNPPSYISILTLLN